MVRLVISALLLSFVSAPLAAETVQVTPSVTTEWKAVYGRIEARDRVPARARIGGTITELLVAEGDAVTQGQVLARIVDEKMGFQLSALESQREGVAAQLANAQAELTRGEELTRQGVSTVQRLDALRTQVDVLTGQLASLDAQARIIGQSQAEGDVTAPAAGRVLDVPVSAGEVVMPGESVALLSGGGTFLRLAVPERHANSLNEGDTIQIEGAGNVTEGRLAKLYPLIENGRVVADVEVQGLSDRFVDARVLVRLPVGERMALMVPQTALSSRGGVDFVAIETAGVVSLRAVVPGQAQPDGMVEILSGIDAGDLVLTEAPATATAEVGHE